MQSCVTAPGQIHTGFVMAPEHKVGTGAAKLVGVAASIAPRLSRVCCKHEISKGTSPQLAVFWPLRTFFLAASLALTAAGADSVPVAHPAFSRDVRSCASCHAAESKQHPDTSMAHAAETVAECSVLRTHPLMKTSLGRYSYIIERKGSESFYTVTDGADTMTVPIRYALGLGAAGQTYVFEKDGKLFESFVSYYKALDGLDITIGDQPLHPSSLGDAAGRLLGVHEVVLCFGCHTTDSIHNGRLVQESLIPGIQCEGCHGPSADHVAGIKSGDPKLAAMKKLGNMSAEESAQFCGQCHRTWDYVATHGPFNAGNVRFQPYRLTISKCFDVDDARISCTTCHDPHRNVEITTAQYDAKCQACHAGGKVGAKICKVATKDCTGCHMPKIELPGSHHRFTDHDIRIVAKNGVYPE
jgi:hypothetical protein